MKTSKLFNLWTASLIIGTTMFSMTAIAQNNPKLTDPEIASVAVTANQIDIDYAAIAKQKSTNADILEFAQTMANDHKAVIDQAVALVTKLHVTPKDNSVTQQLLTGEKTTKKMLESKSGEAFNKAYIDNEVAYHKDVISTVEGVLIPEAQNQELKQLLQNVLPTLKTHLQHAEMVQTKLSK